MFIILGAMPILFSVASAQSLIPASGKVGSCNFITGDLHFDCIPSYLGYMIEFFFGALGFFCIMQVMYAGFQIASANLLGQDRSAGVQRIIWALAGLAAGVLGYVLVDFFLNGIASP